MKQDGTKHQINTKATYTSIRKLNDTPKIYLLSSVISVSSRISKGQGYQGFIRKRAGSSLHRTRKNLKNG
jgi:hypothetical protein